MTHPNRVQPDGTFRAVPARGTLTGNRGVLHRDGVIGAARWKHRAWVSCELEFRGRHRPILPDHRWTALFFLDEATALAAGHRPCGQCRHADYRVFVAAWEQAMGPWPGPRDADARLHAARAHPGARRLKEHPMPIDAIADGSMFRADGQVFLKWHNTARKYAPEGYGPPVDLPSGHTTALTNPVSQSVLKAGYLPRLHPSVFVR